MEYMKPCPFCGGEPHLERNHRNFVKGEPTRVALVRCTQCEAKSGKFDLRAYEPKIAKALAIEAWNRRVFNLASDTPVMANAAISKLVETGDAIQRGMESQNPETRRIANIAYDLTEELGRILSEMNSKQEGK